MCKVLKQSRAHSKSHVGAVFYFSVTEPSVNTLIVNTRDLISVSDVL